MREEADRGSGLAPAGRGGAVPGTLEESPARGGWRLAGNIIVVLWLGVGLYYLVPKLVGDREMLAVVRNANFLLVPVALAVETLSMLCVCRLYYDVLRIGGGALSFPRVSLIYMGAYAFGHVVPGGNAGTVYLNYRELRREGVGRALTVKALGAAYIIYSAALIALLAAGLILSMLTGRLPFAYNVAALSIAGGALIFMAGCAYLVRHPRILNRVLGALLRAFQRARLLLRVDICAVEARVEETIAYLMAIFARRDNAIRTGIWGVGFWLFDLACLYTVFIAIGHPVNPGILMVCYAIADIMGSLPLTPAGLGVFEVSLGATLYAFGYPKEILVTGVLGFRFFSFWLCTLAGGICYLVLLLQRRAEKRALAR
ncbi:MAG: flippase-like domain-containing protein [Actinobacteria bacterium]|nr:flippase-like domain-containing protein [Actinomycetota bacterium]